MSGRAVLVAVLSLAIAGCGTLSDTHHRPGNSHQVATAAPAPGEAHAEVAIEAGRVRPPSGWLEAARGQTVSITVTSDVADEVHVHGYDVKAALRPGEPATVRFVADVTGVFEVETHESDLVLVQVAVR
ncbi:hypothetical protein [Nonomuraea sp. NPDC048826]|uniref:hypothetical protein n=1 Tax=Nonomuraea sp. NPDC048826 TaxID=3364347 RepID=UPI003710CC6C